jgi:hypothetical protein
MLGVRVMVGRGVKVGVGGGMATCVLRAVPNPLMTTTAARPASTSVLLTV